MTAKVQFVIDEAASVGALPPIEDALDKLRSYGVRLILAYQSMGQLGQAMLAGGQGPGFCSPTRRPGLRRRVRQPDGRVRLGPARGDHH